jgi:hypothetical protein
MCTLVWHAIQYYLNGLLGLGGYHLPTHQVRVLVSLAGYQILSTWFAQISQIPAVVWYGQPDIPSNIMCEVLSHQADTICLFIRCRYWSVWRAIKYYLDDPLGSAGNLLNIFVVWDGQPNMALNIICKVPSD